MAFVYYGQRILPSFIKQKEKKSIKLYQIVKQLIKPPWVIPAAGLKQEAARSASGSPWPGWAFTDGVTDLPVNAAAHNSVHRCLRAKGTFAEPTPWALSQAPGTSWAVEGHKISSGNDRSQTCTEPVANLFSATVELWELVKLQGEMPLINKFLKSAST